MTDAETYDTLDGQVALVTGATRGIGERIAAGLVDHGATVFAGAREPAAVEPGRGTPMELDLTDERTMAAAIDRITDEAGRLDILVNNAGILGPRGPLHEVQVGALDETFTVDLRGPVVLTRRTLPLLLESDGGRVVNVSSGMGALGEGMSGGHPAYRIAKTGLNGLTVYLHGEYNSLGLLANAACPGWVRTDMGSPSAPRTPEEGADTPVWLARFRPGAPGGRFWRDRSVIDW